MITLGIETSCDETACGVVKNGRILSDVVATSVSLHRPYGGIVPEIASRCQIEFITGVSKEAIKKAGISLRDLDLIAVTYGPGLAGSLLVGVSFAKALSLALSIPFIGVRHLDAHIYINFVKSKPSSRRPRFPFIGLVVSGGHTSIFLCRGAGDFKILGNTQDDAVGEAFDKVAKILNLGYPGGPVIEKYARASRGKLIDFPRTFLGKDSLDFSFSGVKTAVLYYMKGKRLTRGLIADVARSFQESVFDVIIKKTMMAAEKFKISTVAAGGGVAANKMFRDMMKKACLVSGRSLFIPEKKYCLDNGAMVAALGEALYGNDACSGLDLTVETNLGAMVK